MIDIERS